MMVWLLRIFGFSWWWWLICAVENMTRMLMVIDMQGIIKRRQAQDITSLKDPGISIRRRSLDLLYGMCDVSNAKVIVEELLQYLISTDFAMREELALKASILVYRCDSSVD